MLADARAPTRNVGWHRDVTQDADALEEPVNASRSALSAVATVLLVGACSPAVSPAPSPSGPAASALPPSLPVAIATAAPAATAAPVTAAPGNGSWAEDPPRPLLMDSVVVVTVDELNVRRRPGLGARILGAVRRGQTLDVSQHIAPYEADGYIWYAVSGFSATYEFPGWIAAGTAESKYVERVPARCPDESMTLHDFAGMRGPDFLACFGSRTIEVEGRLRCTISSCFEEVPGTYDPAWLAHPTQLGLLLSVPPSGSLRLRYPPEVGGEPPEETLVRIAGHFDDPRAAECVMSDVYPWAPDGPATPIGAPVARELCRQRFVVEGYQILGPAPTPR